jgi:DNA-binding PadR family transcriptional regulator
MHDYKWKSMRRGSLRIWIISTLQQSPRNGAEIMDQIELASQGWWRPSPGSVYPLLDELEREEITKKRSDGRYELTEKGQKEFEWPWGMPQKQPRTVEEVIAEMGGYVSYLDDLNKSSRLKIAPHVDELRVLRDRLTSLIESP